MKKSKYAILLLVSILILMVAVGCKKNKNELSDNGVIDNTTENSSKKQQTDEEKFDAFLERLALESLEKSPLTATFTIGDLEKNNLFHLASELDHLDLNQIEKDIDLAKVDLKELTTIDIKKLSRDQQLNYELAKFNLEHGIDLAQYKYIENLIQPSAGVQVNFPLALMQIEFETKNEIDAFIKRVKEMPRLVQEVVDYEKTRYDLGYSLPGYLYIEVVKQIEAMMVQPENFMMYLSFVDRIDGFEGLSDSEKDTYKNTYLEIVTNQLYPAFIALKNQALVMEKSQVSGSISQWADGKAYYEALVKYKTSDELDVQGLEEWAASELTSIALEFQRIVAEKPEILELDFENIFPTYETMDDIYKVVNEVYKSEFMDYGVTFATENIIPSYLEEHLAQGFYFPLTVDGEDYGNMFLQAKDYENLTADTAILYYHENIPGHHLYYSYISKSEEPLYRKMNEYLPYEEGWATYVQSLAFSHLGLPDGLDEFFVLNARYSNAFMVLLDIKFHYEGLSIAEVRNELRQIGYEDEDIDSVLNRMISKPGEMIHYMFGEYKMNELKTKYMEKLGDKYTPQNFHDFILSHFGLPFYLLEEEIDNL